MLNKNDLLVLTLSIAGLDNGVLRVSPSASNLDNFFVRLPNDGFASNPSRRSPTTILWPPPDF